MFSWYFPISVLEHFFDLPDLLLDLTFGLLGMAGSLQVFVCGDFSGNLFDVAGDDLGRAFYFIVGAFIHDFLRIDESPPASYGVLPGQPGLTPQPNFDCQVDILR